ncbi:MAG: hypothetical protein JNJ89_18565 [Rubrivivax sp.]|nr:hypothetical protein [Rubrivivax sp.]
MNSLRHFPTLVAVVAWLMPSQGTADPGGAGTPFTTIAQAQQQARSSAGRSGASLDPDNEPVALTAQAQARAGARADVELAELRPGMTAKSAADVLAKRYPSAVRRPVNARWTSPVKAEFTAGLVVAEGMKLQSGYIVQGDIVQAILSTPPGAPEVVAIRRTVTFAPGQESHRDEWVKALEGKYGSVSKRLGRFGEMLVWFFDKARPDDPKAAAGPLSERCKDAGQQTWGLNFKHNDQFGERELARLAEGSAAAGYVNWRETALANQERLGYCGKMLRAVFEAGVQQPPHSPLLGRVDLILVDLDRAATVARKTEALLSGAARSAAEQRLDQARQNRPRL